MDQDEEVGKLLCSSKKVFKLKKHALRCALKVCIHEPIIVATSTDTV